MKVLHIYHTLIGIMVIILSLLLHESYCEEDDTDTSAEVFKVLFNNQHFMELKDDPFFTTKYQKKYDPYVLERMERIDSEPEFTYSIDHISPVLADLPHYLKENEESESRNQGIVVKPTDDPDRDFFDNYEKYFDDRFGETHAALTQNENEEEDEGEGEAPVVPPEENHRKKHKKHKKRKGKKKKKAGKKKEEDHDEESNDAAYKYSIDFSPSEEYDRIKAISDKQRANLKKDPNNCKVYTQNDGQTCFECLDPSTGDTSESCSYEEEPRAAKYVHEKERHYDSKTDSPNEEDFEESEYSEEETTPNPKKTQNSRSYKPNSNSQKKNNRVKKSQSIKQAPKDADYDNQYNDDDYYAESNNFFDYENDAEVLQPYKHSFYFSAPHKTHEEMRVTENPSPYSPVYDSKTNIDEALKDFDSRDWSLCKKRAQGDLTCYVCKDRDGANHEECMFVQESRPKSVRVVYRGPKRQSTPLVPETTFATTPKPSTTFAASPSSYSSAFTSFATTASSPSRTTRPDLSTVHPPTRKFEMKPPNQNENRRKTKKIVIVKRRKPGEVRPLQQKRNADDDEVLEKRTIKRTIAVSVTGNGVMPTNYTSSIMHDAMNDDHLKDEAFGF